MAKTKAGVTLTRHHRAMGQKAFHLIRHLPIPETQPAHLLKAIEAGSVSKNIFLRRLHNFALDMAWLPWPVLAKKRWPQIRFKEKRAVTWEEHSAIVAAENNPERRAYYECCWHLGAAQSDIANLTAEDIDWQSRVVSLCRQKTGTPCIIRFGAELEAILRALPQTGPLFPNHRTKRETHRAREFARACNRLSIGGDHAAQLPLRLGRAREEVRLPGTVRPGSARPQQQGRSPRRCAQGAGPDSGAGRL